VTRLPGPAGQAPDPDPKGPAMSSHTVTVTHTDTRSKYGRPKRQYHAACDCGWIDPWSPVSKAASIEHGADHVTANAR
jgi:hypothetical protein